MSENLRVLVVGCGTQGAHHARAYHRLEGFEIVGLVDRDPANCARLAKELGGPPQFDEYESALAAVKPDGVSISTWPDTHGRFALQALKAGAHVFIEKPLAETVKEAQAVVRLARQKKRKVLIGYILQHHPTWIRFIEVARTLGKPLVMRMNLNQQSVGAAWEVHKRLMDTMSPIVDCGVHYVDVMCQMTLAKPVRVQAIGARLTDEISRDMYNYGQLQVVFDDGSVGWYEAGWGPMMSEEAFFVKDVLGPKGCVSIVAATAKEKGTSADIDSHTQANALRVHLAESTPDGTFAKPDRVLDTPDEPDHQGLCDREQAYWLRAIREDLDLAEHCEAAVNSLRVVLAADKSVRTGRVVNLK
jgi:predicted dehydrogenase